MDARFRPPDPVDELPLAAAAGAGVSDEREPSAGPPFEDAAESGAEDGLDSDAVDPFRVVAGERRFPDPSLRLSVR